MTDHQRGSDTNFSSEEDTTERTGIRCDTCGDTIVPEYLDTAEEMAADRCYKCGDGFFELVDVETVPVERVRDRLDQLEPVNDIIRCLACGNWREAIDPIDKRTENVCSSCGSENVERRELVEKERVRDDLTEQGDGGG